MVEKKTEFAVYTKKADINGPNKVHKYMPKLYMAKGANCSKGYRKYLASQMVQPEERDQ